MKTFILDTNVLLHDPTSLLAFEDNEIVIPLVVIEEVDHFKTKEQEIGRNARTAIRMLDELREIGNLSKGVKLSNGGMLRIETKIADTIPAGIDINKVDNQIILVALGIAEKNKRKKVILVSKDLNMRIKCDSLGVSAQDYQRDKMVDSVDELYSGSTEVVVADSMIDSFHNGGEVLLEQKLYPNQFVLLRSEINPKKSALAKFTNEFEPLEKVLEYKSVWKIAAKNKEQTFALNLLMDPAIKLVSLIGQAGCGKTLLSIAAALEQTMEKKLYSRIIISRPIQPMGKDLGYLPGNLDEKMAPWIAPINDNLEFLFNGDMRTIQMLKETGIIEVEALSYIRGRSIPNSFILIDEAQNLSRHELKTIITRAGEGSKIVLTGDVEQIDAQYLDAISNGLSIAVEKFRDYDVAGHITLKTGVRSDLASLAAKIL